MQSISTRELKGELKKDPLRFVTTLVGTKVCPIVKLSAVRTVTVSPDPISPNENDPNGLAALATVFFAECLATPFSPSVNWEAGYYVLIFPK